MRLVLLGPPGAGKGTQGQRLAAHYGVPHVATGDIVRDHIARRTEFGRKVEAAIAAGNFAPDADIIYWVRRRLAEPDARHGYILDGFPRDLAQAGLWDAQTRDEHAPLDAVVELVIAADELIARLSGRLICPVCDTSYHVTQRPPRTPGRCDNDGAVLVRRPDDEPEAVRRRLRIYEDVTRPLHDYYRAQGLLYPVEAGGEADSVTERIVFCLQDLKSAAVGV
ncbi:MAG: adenylate kinase [Armatimonadetes bacterium]|nr:adenylate kinase [Armatimonadota bacterium]